MAKLIARGIGFVSARQEKAAAARARYAVFEEPAAGPGSPQVLVMRDFEAGVEAAVTPLEGGELTSLRVKFRLLPVELLYRAREYEPTPVFRGKATLLWPALGPALPTGARPVADRLYPGPGDGFAMALPWKETGRSSGVKGAWVTLELKDTEQSRMRYPFGFEVQTAYLLADGQVTILYTLSAAARNPAPMPFSIGNRMAFRLPFVEGTEPGAMRFQTPCSKQLLRTGEGILSGAEVDRSFAEPARLDDFDAVTPVSLAGYAGAPSARLTDPQGISLHISHQGSTTMPEPVVRFNVLGGPQMGFLCVESRFGMPDCNTPAMLNPGAQWQWSVILSPQVALEP